jgi:hypothetical protein
LKDTEKAIRVRQDEAKRLAEARETDPAGIAWKFERKVVEDPLETPATSGKNVSPFVSTANAGMARKKDSGACPKPLYSCG